MCPGAPSRRSTFSETHAMNSPPASLVRSIRPQVHARCLMALTLGLLILAPSRAQAVTETACTFQPPLTNFTLNQNAFNALNTEIRLTDAIANETGTFFTTTPITLAATTSFHAHFIFQMGPSAAGGDGIAFVLQNSAAGAAAIGTGALQMGYGGITPSVVVQFNTYKNSGTDPNANNVSLMLNGSSTVFTATGTPAFTMAGAGLLNGWVDYNSSTTTLTAYVATTATKPATAIFSHAVNLFTTLGAQAYVGFTSATGTSPEVNEHDVYELEFSTDGIPCQCEGDGACSGATPACDIAGICAICSATNSTACTGTTKVCDVPTNTCVGCLTSATCTSPTPICGTAMTCRACASAADCGGATPECATTGANAGDCVACIADANCPPATPRCTPTNTCVQCESNADCGGDTPVCSTGTCKACTSDASCSGATPACEVWGACGQCSATNATECGGSTDICDFPTGTCVDCEFNSDCSGSTPTCNTTTHTCRACTDNADCMGNPGGSACVTTGMKAGSCVTCAKDSDCSSTAAPICDTVANECVACLTSTDCSGATPVCNTSNLCVGCLTSADCSATPMTPVCNPASSVCTACANDYAASNPGALACPTAALPACQTAGTPLAGQCALCSASNNSTCVTLPATPVCIASSAQCGCVTDSDCNPDSYCDTSSLSTGTCAAGCRVLGDAGATNCATGKYCSETNGSLGTCMSEPCNDNTDCSAPNPVCNTIGQPHSCVACLNSTDCVTGQVCDTMDTCVECTTNQTKNCAASGTGAACLASGTCGCATDTDCGGSTSGRVCNTVTSACEQGCRGTGGNGCTAPATCSSTSGAIGQCHGVTAMDAGMAGKDAGGADAGSAGQVTTESTGCGCRVGGGSAPREAPALLGVAVGLALAARRRRSGSARGER